MANENIDIEPRVVPWQIKPTSDNSISIDKTELNFEEIGEDAAQTIVATNNLSSSVIATPEDTSIADTHVIDKTIYVVPKAEGQTNILIHSPGDNNHVSSEAVSCAVNVVDLAKNPTPEWFAKIIKAGDGPNYYSVGDTIGIPINGTVGTISIDDTYYPQILGFNHNQEVEGTGNYVDLQWARSSNNGTLGAFCDSNYGVRASNGFVWEPGGYNDPGYFNSYINQTIAAEFYAAIDEKWRSIICESIKYSDEGPTGGDEASRVKSNRYLIWLLSEFEVFGDCVLCNKYEAQYQQQYDMYANGFNGVRTGLVNQEGKLVYWWLRSLVPSLRNRVTCYDYAIDAIQNMDVYTSSGYSPGTRIGDAPPPQTVGTLDVEPAAMIFSGIGVENAQNLTVTTSNEGTPSITASEPEIVTTEALGGGLISVTPNNYGDTLLTIGVAADGWHTSPEAKTIPVNVIDLRNVSAADFQRFVSEGNAPNLYTPGDSIGIPLKGTFGTVELDATYYPQILGFNHNEGKEGTTGNYVDLQWATSESGAQIAFVDAKFAQSTVGSTELYFSMNLTRTSAGGYAETHMRKNVLPTMDNVLPEDWKSIIVPATKYSDNVGGGSGSALEHFTPIVDRFWLLSALEVTNDCSIVNVYESEFQKHYSMYASGIVPISRVRHNGSGATIAWFTRSPIADHTSNFCTITTTVNSHNPAYSYGVAPGCRIA